MRRAQGFTLVEVMIAVAILASLTALMWVSIANMYASRDLLEMRAERFQKVRVTMDRISDDFAAAYIAGPDFAGEEIPGEPIVEDNDEQSFIEDPIQFGFIARESEANFTTFSHVRTQPGEKASRHAEVGYFIRTVRDDETNKLVKKLMRRQDVTPDDRLERGGKILTLLDEIEDIKFMYWDAGQVKVGDLEEVAEGRWVDDWDTTRRDQAARLPTRIKIRLELPGQGPNEDKEVFVTQVQLSTTEILEF